MNDVGVCDLVQEGEVRNAAVLDLHILKTIKTLLVSICKHAQSVKESTRVMGHELAFEGIYGRGGLSDIGGGKGDSRSCEKGRDGGLHLVYVID